MTRSLLEHRKVLVTRQQLLARGFSPDEIKQMYRKGVLERPYYGIYAPALPPSDRLTHRRERFLRHSIAAAIQAPSCVVSHISGIAIHGLPLAQADLSTAHLLRASPTGGVRRAGTWIHSGRISQEEIIRFGDIAVTSVPRTLIDLARTESVNNTVAIADAALFSQRVSVAELEAALVAAAGSHGVPRARRALALVDGRSESVGESLTRLRLGPLVPRTVDLQVDIFNVSGDHLGRADFGIEEAALLVEFDGEVKYRRLRRPGESVEDAVIREKIREDRLREAGFVVLRLTWSDLRDRRHLADRIHTALTQGRRARAAGLVTGRYVPTAPVQLGK